MRGTPDRADNTVLTIRIIPAHAGNSRAQKLGPSYRSDHPRACGELAPAATASPTPRGSSPRMRGTLPRVLLGQGRVRIIPAHAGNSSSATSTTGSCAGSSPRMRGTPHCREYRRWRTRIIPAHAGNSSSLRRRMSVSSDHPRACGELVVVVGKTTWYAGSSPRMRGTLVQTGETYGTKRIIPAHAGNSCHRGRCYRQRPDHPRACGELGLGPGTRHGHGGSSPRMRGTPCINRRPTQHTRIIPAHAGNSRSWRSSSLA